MNHANPLKVAWIGTPNLGGGVAGFCRQLLSGLIASGEDVTAFTQLSEDDFWHAVGNKSTNAKVVSRVTPWEWGRWYSCHPTVSFISSFWKRRGAYKRLVLDLVEANKQSPFDVIVQFSQIEIFNLAKHLPKLPPVILFPCVHAAGELYWHRLESRYARQSENWLRHYLIRSNLYYRSKVQKQSCQRVSGVIGMSRRFNQLLAADYAVRPENQAVIYQPTERESHYLPQADQSRGQDGKVKLLFVGRVSVRKGIELVVELSHRLADLEQQVHLEIIGGGSLWSDYTKHLRNLNPKVASFSGSLDNAAVINKMKQAHCLIVPSHYEPGGIVVAEALSHGCAVVVSNEVGSAEPLSGFACRKFAAGNLKEFETAVRQIVCDAQSNPQKLAASATELAHSCFDFDSTIIQLRKILRQAAGRNPISQA